MLLIFLFTKVNLTISFSTLLEALQALDNVITYVTLVDTFGANKQVGVARVSTDTTQCQTW